MKKVLSAFLIFLFVFLIGTSYAADEYSFDLEYTGEIIVDEEKNAAVTLTGVNGPLYTNVRIKVDITGPAVPKILAYDSLGTEYDIAQIGYWGPPDGFAVQGSFTNRTPIRATFTKAGEYTIKLSLIDVKNNDNVIITKDIVLTVKDKVTNEESNTTNNTVEENKIEEIPKTGLSYEEMCFMAVAVIAVLLISLKVIKSRKETL